MKERTRTPRWPALPLARPDCLLQQPSSRSVLMCRKRQLWSLSTPNASGLPASPTARPHRSRDWRLDLFASLQDAARRNRKGAARHSARNGRRFPNCRKTCDFAVKATCWERGKAGYPGFRIARPELHGQYLGAARDDAALVLGRDPTLATPRGEALRQLLYLFGKDEAIKLIRAG